ncbi:MAG: hypothetical protein KGL39_30180 [Patescibacteria group bacterium]|nr:hypothetical protein [Patescibacteria group bacterium]
MAKDSRLGDKFPVNHNVKWGSMMPGESHLSNEWHEMEACEPKFSEKWDEQHPSKGHMSEKWDHMDAGSTEFSDKWHDMKQDHRMDPYSMAPHYEDREVGMKKQSSNDMKNSGHGRYQISGSEGQSGKGL